MSSFEIAELAEKDMPLYRALMMRAVREEPTSFPRSPEEFQGWNERQWREHVPNRVFCAYRENQMVGVAGLYSENRSKKSHKLVLGPVYVVPESRGIGIARALVGMALQCAFDPMGMRAVRLTVTDRDSPAVKLYLSLGFSVWGREPQAILVDGQFYNDLHMQISQETWVSDS